MNYKILIIDDEEYMHIFTNRLLGPEYTLVSAKEAQEAIDILSEETIHLILSDIHMPGLSGLEFLESLKKDAGKKQIPVLIMTNLPSVDKEKKALDLGAADFIDKRHLVNNKESLLELIRMKLVSNVRVTDADESLIEKKSQFVSALLEAALSRDFDMTAETFTNGIADKFSADFVGFWAVKEEEGELICTAASREASSLSDENISEQDGFRHIREYRQSYLTNSITTAEHAFYPERSTELDLSAEIAIPIFAMTERDMLIKNLDIPDTTDLFGIVVIKRNKLFSTDEYEVISGLVKQSGSILWRLYSNNKPS